MDLKRTLRLALVGGALTCITVLGVSAASVGAGTVNTDALRLREAAGTDTAILATVSKGTSVILLEDAVDGWYKVDYKTVVGYMSAEYLDVKTTADVAIGYGKVTTDGTSLNVRSGASTDFDKVGSLSNGAVVDIVGVDNGWYKVSTGSLTGYVSSDYVVTVKGSDLSRGDATPASTVSDLGSEIVAYAKKFMGVPYRYGANGPNAFDCSGYTSYVYKHFGYTINRGASGQTKNGSRVASMSDLVPGDLVFFNSGDSRYIATHVGIYVGDGKFIHASTGDGRNVQVDVLTSGHYSRIYIGGRHII